MAGGFLPTPIESSGPNNRLSSSIAPATARMQGRHRNQTTLDCASLRKTHLINSCVHLNDGKTPAITGENGLTRAGCVCPDPNGRRIRCALQHQRRTISAFPITHAIASPGPPEAGFLFPCATDRRVTQGGNRHYLPVGLPSYSPVTFTSAPNLLASASCSASGASGSTYFRHLA